MDITPIVRKTKGGNLVWRSTMDRNAALRRFLINTGYKTQLALAAFGYKYYVARKTSSEEAIIEKVFRNRAQAERYRNQWAARPRMYDSISILNRDTVEILAAEELLANS